MTQAEIEEEYEAYDAYTEYETTDDTQQQESSVVLVESIDKSDKRFANNAAIKAKDASLGQIAEIIDVVLHPQLERRISKEEVISRYLGCATPLDVACIKRDYVGYRGKLVRIGIHKLLTDKKSGPYRPEQVSCEIDGKHYTIVNSEPTTELVEVEPGVFKNIPAYFRETGLTKNNGKAVISLILGDFDDYILIIRVPKNDLSFGNGIIEFLDKWIDDNNIYKGRAIDPDCNFLHLEPKTWKDIVLSDKIMKSIRKHILNFFDKSEIYKKNGIPNKRGVVFEGPPGTGKSMTGKILATTAFKNRGVTFIWVSASNMYSTTAIKRLFDLARDLAPSILFIEDADLFFQDRSMEAHNPMLGEIMNSLDGIVELDGILTIMTSNNPGILEGALINRPGRFDIRIEFNPPEQELVIKMLKKFLSGIHLSAKNLNEIAKSASEAGLTGSHVRELATRAIINAIDDGKVDSKGIATVDDKALQDALSAVEKMVIQSPSQPGRDVPQAAEAYNIPPIDQQRSELAESIGKLGVI